MFEAFVLAGGQSKRMGREKALLEIGKRPMLDIAVDILKRSGAQKVTVVSGRKSQSLSDHFPDIEFTDDISEGLGAPGGIYTALKQSEADDVFILGCDFPFVSPELIEFLLARMSRGEYDAVIPVQPDGFKQTLVAAYRKSACLVPFQAEILRSDVTPSVRDLLKKVSAAYVDFDEFSSLDGSGDFFININTPDDLTDARKMFRGE